MARIFKKLQSGASWSGCHLKAQLWLNLWRPLSAQPAFYSVWMVTGGFPKVSNTAGSPAALYDPPFIKQETLGLVDTLVVVSVRVFAHPPFIRQETLGLVHTLRIVSVRVNEKLS